jgi:hypothetical protein
MTTVVDLTLHRLRLSQRRILDLGVCTDEAERSRALRTAVRSSGQAGRGGGGGGGGGGTPAERAEVSQRAPVRLLEAV